MDRPIPPSADRPTETDLPCAACGYNLRDLPPSGRCPECGTPIRQSLHGDLLAAADPRWLRTVIRGQQLFYYGLIGFFLFFIQLVAMVISAMAGLDVSGLVLGLLRITALAMMCISPFVMALGAFLMTAPSAHDARSRGTITKRTVVRWLLVTLVLLLTLRPLLTTLLMPRLAARGPLPVNVLGLWTLSVGLALLLVVIAGARYLATLIMRVPDPTTPDRLRVSARRLGVAIGIVTAIQCVKLIIHLLRPGAVSMEWPNIVQSLIGLAALGYTAQLYQAMGSARSALRHCLVQAEQLTADYNAPSHT